MARVEINSAQARLTATRLSTKAVREMVRAVEIQAKVRASVGEYTTGRLTRSITSRVWVSGVRVNGSVGSLLPYAHLADSGAKPHRIEPGRPPWALRFYWRKVGRVVYRSHVNHPGQSGKGWLTGPLTSEARRRGWKVIIHD
jgi:hypothetical protein